MSGRSQRLVVRGGVVYRVLKWLAIDGALASGLMRDTPDLLATVGATVMAICVVAYVLGRQSTDMFGVFTDFVGLGFRGGEVTVEWSLSFIPPFTMPLWAPVLLLATPTAYFIWLARRPGPRAGHCPSCGYDRRGTVSPVCPECGEGRRKPVTSCH